MKNEKIISKINSENYYRSNEYFPKIVHDETDHLGFFCKVCNKILITTEVETKIVKDLTNKDYCTNATMWCEKCKKSYRFKWYWELSKHDRLSQVLKCFLDLQVKK